MRILLCVYIYINRSQQMNDDRINIKQRRGDGKGVSYRIVSTPSTILNTNLCC